MMKVLNLAYIMVVTVSPNCYWPPHCRHIVTTDRQRMKALISCLTIWVVRPPRVAVQTGEVKA